MIIISEGFYHPVNIKHHSAAYVVKYPLMLGKKKKNKYCLSLYLIECLRVICFMDELKQYHAAVS